jgi:hypothetical protein
MLVTMLVGVVAVVVPRRTMCVFSRSKADVASLTVKRFATEAYPQWLAAHPAETCPRSLDELNEFTDSKDGLDPWGSRYVMWCIPNGPFLVWSRGEDQRVGTPDDIHSWDR